MEKITTKNFFPEDKEERKRDETERIYENDLMDTLHELTDDLLLHIPLLKYRDLGNEILVEHLDSGTLNKLIDVSSRLKQVYEHERPEYKVETGYENKMFRIKITTKE